MRCQIPNGWGYQIPNNTSQSNYVPSYQLKLNAPVKVTTLVGTVLEFPAQIRSGVLLSMGADNAVSSSRWAVSHYELIASVTVLDGAVVLGATKSTTGSLAHGGQVGWALGFQNTLGTVAYALTVTDTLPDTLTYLGLHECCHRESAATMEQPVYQWRRYCKTGRVTECV